jgi:hypothetical protein
VAFVPDFIPTTMDDFEYDSGAGTATIEVNMNTVLVQNKASAFVLPFH